MLCSGDKTLFITPSRCLTVLPSILAGDRPSTTMIVVSHIIVRNLQVVEIQDVKTEMYDGKMKREIERRGIYILYTTQEREKIYS
tara:strand:- start:149 stop:403 length:255 start_codon:yes stop_codon:yes gene_type:complete